jgi:DNA-binding transcriptional MerR regulator
VIIDAVEYTKSTYNVSRSTLINWEKEGLITPVFAARIYGQRGGKKHDNDTG